MATWSATSRGCVTCRWRGMATLDLSACGNPSALLPRTKEADPGPEDLGDPASGWRVIALVQVTGLHGKGFAAV